MGAYEITTDESHGGASKGFLWKPVARHEEFLGSVRFLIDRTRWGVS